MTCVRNINYVMEALKLFYILTELVTCRTSQFPLNEEMNDHHNYQSLRKYGLLEVKRQKKCKTKTVYADINQTQKSVLV